MTGLELLRAPGTTAEQITDIIAEHCPPVVPTECDRLSCRECWLSWLTTGEPPKATGSSDKQTAPVSAVDLTRLKRVANAELSGGDPYKPYNKRENRLKRNKDPVHPEHCTSSQPDS